TDCRMMREVVVEDASYIHSVGSLQRSSQAKCEVAVDLREHTPVGRCVGVVDLVDDGVVELLSSESLKPLWSREFLNRRDHDVAIQVAAIAEVPSGPSFAKLRVQDHRQRRFGLGEDMGAMGDDQYARPLIETLTNLSR